MGILLERYRGRLESPKGRIRHRHGRNHRSGVIVLAPIHQNDGKIRSSVVATCSHENILAILHGKFEIVGVLFGKGPIIVPPVAVLGIQWHLIGLLVSANLENTGRYSIENSAIARHELFG